MNTTTTRIRTRIVALCAGAAAVTCIAVVPTSTYADQATTGGGGGATALPPRDVDEFVAIRKAIMAAAYVNRR